MPTRWCTNSVRYAENVKSHWARRATTKQKPRSAPAWKALARGPSPGILVLVSGRTRLSVTPREPRKPGGETVGPFPPCEESRLRQAKGCAHENRKQNLHPICP